MTFAALLKILEILFVAEGRLLGKKSFHILETWADEYLAELQALTNQEAK